MLESERMTLKIMEVHDLTKVPRTYVLFQFAENPRKCEISLPFPAVDFSSLNVSDEKQFWVLDSGASCHISW